ncbi:MAG: 2-succinyl-5-enolpyruvyl-6-hydroxy-3-cyclohexene-1-carboxylic-acid synthase [candidate division Zixibacteria bacterium]|nr:2-succinyl-5-enolpyruvyl-6-hydroxy-3-cyclohexene-1-carboxylic-acid synthase [candidate division Zixibacteria bacterium]
MQTQFDNINLLWGRLIIEELVRGGVSCFSLASGSRSTPLVLGIAEQNNVKVKTTVHFDERGAAFYALGYAKATGSPAVVVCTSGTAAANFFPAIVEASESKIPLIVLTADRPPELKDSAANQTINQSNLYGRFVRWQFDMPCPDKKIAPEFVLTTVDQALNRSLSSPPGPVHLNCMFREPLAPTGNNKDFSAYMSNLTSWLQSKKPFTTYSRPELRLSEDQLKEPIKIINETKSGLIVVGKVNAAESNLVESLARRLGWPLMPDIASGLRLGSENSKITISYFDLMLAADSSLLADVDTVLQFGDQPVSKRLLKSLNSARPKNYIQIASHAEREDPNHQVTLRLECSVASFCKSLEQIIRQHGNSELAETLSNQSKQIDKTLNEILDSNDAISEPAVCRAISRQIADSAALFLGNSLPVREINMFAAVTGLAAAVEYNRGVSGIDGTIATAVGYANGIHSPVTLSVGDLTFLHDLNSLKLARDSKQPLTIVVFNNDGGGIFSFLPVASQTEDFEKFFGTPHGLSFENSARQFGLNYFQPVSMKEFNRVYTACQKSNKSSIIEVKTERSANFKLHQEIIAALKKVLSGS